jgi:hypothetical protein
MCSHLKNYINVHLSFSLETIFNKMFMLINWAEMRFKVGDFD